MLAVVRIKGRVKVRKQVEATLQKLRLKAPNNCVLLPEEPSMLGMLSRVRDFVAYGKINRETLVKLLRKRLRMRGVKGKKVEEKALREATGFGFEGLADSLLEGKRLADFKKLCPVLRLTPPSKGHRSTKLHYPKGSLGDWGEDINKLLERMM